MKISDTPFVSIFIPVYNGASYLPETLNSILLQTESSLEILCVDDMSNDGSLDILNDYSKRDARVRVFSKPKGGLVPAAWNFIMPHLKGQFVLYMSQDDLLAQNFIQICRDKYEETKADIIVPDMVWYYSKERNNKYQIVGLEGDHNAVLKGHQAFEWSLRGKINAFALYDRMLVLAHSADERMFNADDLMGRLRMLHAKKVVFAKTTFYYRQDNADAITKKMRWYVFSKQLTQMSVLELVSQHAPHLLKRQVKAFWPTFCDSYCNYLIYRKRFTAEERNTILKFFSEVLSRARQLHIERHFSRGKRWHVCLCTRNLYVFKFVAFCYGIIRMFTRGGIKRRVRKLFGGLLKTKCGGVKC